MIGNTTAHRRSAAVFLAFLAAACGDGPTAPRVGTLRVSVQSSGGDVDVDGFELIVDSSVRQSLAANAIENVKNISVGPHTVSLTSVAANCTVRGPNPRPVDVIDGRTIDVTFEIGCVATAIEVTTHTTGVAIPGAYQLLVNGQSPVAIDANGSATVGRLEPGMDTVALIIPSDNCTVAGGNRIAVPVSAGVVTTVKFDVDCVTPARVERIAYTVDSVANGAVVQWIATIKLDGSGRTLLRPGNSPSWSPDGTRLVFSDAHCVSYYYRYYYGCIGGLLVMDPETLQLTVPTGGDGAFEPAWSPTGDAFTFLTCCLSNLAGADVPGILYTLDVDTSLALHLTTGANVLDAPAWSPDGQQLAFGCVVDLPTPASPTPNWDLCTAQKDGSSIVRLTSDAIFESDPAWSPDGKRIAFTQGQGNVGLLNLSDGAVTLLTDGREPAWSPDGTKLVFVGVDGLYTINADGSNRKLLVTGNVSAPAWRP